MIQAIRPDVDAKLPDRWTRRFLLRLDGAEQQVRVAARCDLETGVYTYGWLHISAGMQSIATPSRHKFAAVLALPGTL